MTASATLGTESVAVSKIGVSISPISFTCVEPASFPYALPRKTAPGTLSLYRLPPCGRIAVTPVRMLSPRISVVCPTLTPATSVMAFSGPGGNTPTFTPRSRTLGRLSVCAQSTAPGVSNKVAREKIRASQESFISILVDIPVDLPCDPLCPRGLEIFHPILWLRIRPRERRPHCRDHHKAK